MRRAAVGAGGPRTQFPRSLSCVEPAGPHGTPQSCRQGCARLSLGCGVGRPCIPLCPGPPRRAAESGRRDGLQRWAAEMGRRDGPQRRAAETGRRDGPQRWAAEMGPRDGCLRWSPRRRQRVVASPGLSLLPSGDAGDKRKRSQAGTRAGQAPEGSRARAATASLMGVKATGKPPLQAQGRIPPGPCGLGPQPLRGLHCVVTQSGFAGAPPGCALSPPCPCCCTAQG